MTVFWGGFFPERLLYLAVSKILWITAVTKQNVAGPKTYKPLPEFCIMELYTH